MLKISLFKKRLSDPYLKKIKRQSIRNIIGEVRYRKIASFGEPEKVLKLAKKRIEERKPLFEKLRYYHVKFSPFLELGAERGQTALQVVNDYRAEGFATDISAESLTTIYPIKSFIGYKKLPVLICCDINKLPFKNNSLNFVFSFQTLHHLASLPPIMEEVNRVLAPKGYFYFAEEPIRKDSSVPGWQETPEELEYDILEQRPLESNWLKALKIFKIIEKNYTLNEKMATHIEALVQTKKRGKAQVYQTIFNLLRCPNCKSDLLQEAHHLFCKRCGPFPNIQGVHYILPRHLLKSLYNI